MTHRYDRLINSTVAFVAALFLSITLHEFAHGLMALWLGVTPTVFAGHEDHVPLLSTGREVVTALAGPGFRAHFITPVVAWMMPDTAA